MYEKHNHIELERNGFIEFGTYKDVPMVFLDGYQSDAMELTLEQWEDLRTKIDEYFYRSLRRKDE